MKNSKSTKITALLLALVLITSCFTVGTFAKYVSKGEGANAARVAKWGVEIAAAEGLFAEEYVGTDTEAITVKATEKVVAPGTTGSLSGLKISGTPEVAGTLSFAADVELTGWGSSTEKEVPASFVGAIASAFSTYNISRGSSYSGVCSINVTQYPDWRDRLEDTSIWSNTGKVRGGSNISNWAKLNDWKAAMFEFKGEWYLAMDTVGTTSGGSDAFVTIYKPKDGYLTFETITVEEAYIPLIVKVGEETEINGLNYNSVDEFVAAVEEAITGFTVSFEPGKDLSEIELPTISWEWPFSTSEENDVKDTLMGNAEIAPSISINLTVSATQID